MSSLVPDTSFSQGASGPADVYDTSPAGLGLSPSYLASSSASASASGGASSGSTGIVSAFAGSSAPVGFVLCDGSTYDGTMVTYAALFAVIGTTYGGSGISAFNVPDLRGRVVVCKGTNAAVNALNANDGQAVANRRPQHQTTLTDPGHRHQVNGSSGSGGGINGINAGIVANTGAFIFTGTNGTLDSTGITAGSGVGTDATDAPSFVVLNYIIAL